MQPFIIMSHVKLKEVAAPSNGWMPYCFGTKDIILFILWIILWSFSENLYDRRLCPPPPDTTSLESTDLVDIELSYPEIPIAAGVWILQSQTMQKRWERPGSQRVLIAIMRTVLQRQQVLSVFAESQNRSDISEYKKSTRKDYVRPNRRNHMISVVHLWCTNAVQATKDPRGLKVLLQTVPQWLRDF